MNISLLEKLKVYFEHFDCRGESLTEDLEIIEKYLRYGEELGIEDYAVFREEYYPYIYQYLYRAFQLLHDFPYPIFKKGHQMLMQLKSDTPLHLAEIKELLEKAKTQNEGLTEKLDEVYRHVYALNNFHYPEDEVITKSETESEDGIKTFLFNTYVGGPCYDSKEGIEFGRADATLKVCENEDGEITYVEVTHHTAYSPRGPRGLFHLTLDDFDKPKVKTK